MKEGERKRSEKGKKQNRRCGKDVDKSSGTPTPQNHADEWIERIRALWKEKGFKGELTPSGINFLIFGRRKGKPRRFWGFEDYEALAHCIESVNPGKIKKSHYGYFVVLAKKEEVTEKHKATVYKSRSPQQLGDILKECMDRAKKPEV